MNRVNIHLPATIFVDLVGNWLFNILIFQSLQGLDNQLLWIAGAMSLIRLSGFFSNVLGGAVLREPLRVFAFFTMIRIVSLILVLIMIQSYSDKRSITILLLICLFLKNTFSGVDNQIYNSLINSSGLNQVYFYKKKEILSYISLVFSGIIFFYFSIEMIILFDFFSYLLLFSLLICYQIPKQKLKKTFLLSFNDIHRVLRKSNMKKECLLTLFTMNIFFTPIFNSSYSFFFDLFDHNGAPLCYAFTGVTFLLGYLIMHMTSDKRLYHIPILLIFIMSLGFISLGSNLSKNLTMMIFFGSNIVYSFFLSRLNIKYFSHNSPEDSVIFSSMYGLTFLSSSLLGTWTLGFLGAKQFLVMIILLFIFTFLLRFLFSLFFAYRELSCLKKKGFLIQYCLVMNNKFIYLYSESNISHVNANIIITNNLSGLLSIFRSISIIFSEVTERLISLDRIKRSEVSNKLPFTNGAACHLTAIDAERSAYNEILERDSIICHLFVKSTGVFKVKSSDVGIDFINACFYFFETCDENVLSVLLLGSESVGYSTIDLNSFSNLGSIKKALEHSVQEFLVGSESHRVAKLKAPIYEKEGIQEYFNKNKLKYNASSCMFQLVIGNIDDFRFLNKTPEFIIENLSVEYAKTFLSSKKQFSKIKPRFETKFFPEYYRYYSFVVSNDHVSPVWPEINNINFKKLRLRYKKNNLDSIDKLWICPIV